MPLLVTRGTSEAEIAEADLYEYDSRFVSGADKMHYVLYGLYYYFKKRIPVIIDV